MPSCPQHRMMRHWAQPPWFFMTVLSALSSALLFSAPQIADVLAKLSPAVLLTLVGFHGAARVCVTSSTLATAHVFTSENKLKVVENMWCEFTFKSHQPQTHHCPQYAHTCRRQCRSEYFIRTFMSEKKSLCLAYCWDFVSGRTMSLVLGLTSWHHYCIYQKFWSYIWPLQVFPLVCFFFLMSTVNVLAGMSLNEWSYYQW